MVFLQLLLSKFFKDLFTCIDIRKYFNLKIAKQWLFLSMIHFHPHSNDSINPYHYGLDASKSYLSFH